MIVIVSTRVVHCAARVCLACVCLLGMRAAPTAAQPPLLTPQGDPPARATSPADAPDRMQQVLQRIRAQSRELNSYAEALDDSAPMEVEPVEVDPATARPIVGVHRELDQLRAQKEQRILRIKSKLLELQRRLHEQHEAERQPVAPAADPGASNTSAPPVASPPPSGSGSSSAAPREPDSPTTPDPGSQAVPTHPGTEPGPDPFPISDAVLVSSKAVDRLELANSLFAIGRTESALAIYGAIDQNGLPEGDRIWLDYQLAACHRRMGNLSDAEKLYRRVVAAGPDSTWSSYARWWLDLLRDRNQVKQELNALQQVIDTYQISAEAQDAR